MHCDGGVKVACGVVGLRLCARGQCIQGIANRIVMACRPLGRALPRKFEDKKA